MSRRKKSPTQPSAIARDPDAAVTELTSLDWDHFASHLWEKRVVHFRAGALPPFTDAQVFAATSNAALVQARRTYGHGARPPMQLTIERMQQSGVAQGAPRRADGSFAGYLTRMAELLGGRRYALVLSELHSFSFELWDQERRFLAELWRRLGLPLTGAISTLFHGNYEQTPVGVHRDRFGTFLFLLRGKKRMRFWAERPWSAPVTTMFEYQPYLEQSFAVELAPGEALYWPSRYYHVGENLEAEPATSVNIGVPIGEHHTSYYVDDLSVGMIDELDLPDETRVRSRLTAVEGSPLVRPALGEDNVLSARLPEPLRQAIASVRKLAEPRATKRHLQRTWLARVTAGGLEPVPPPAKRAPLEAEQQVQLVAGAALRWVASRGEDGEPVVLCAGNGHLVEAQPDATVIELLQQLAAGYAWRIGELLREVPRGRAGGRGERSDAPDDALDDAVLPATRQGMLQLLEQLVALRVLQVVEPRPARKGSKGARPAM